MNWRKLFKPTLPKIMVFLLLPVFIGGACNAKLNPCPLENTLFSFLPLVVTVLLLIPSLFIELPESEFVQKPIGGWSYLPAIYLIGALSLVINYLIACSLVFLYNEVKHAIAKK